jgi:hypothetical protein
MKSYFNQKSEVNRDDALKLDFTLTVTGPAAEAQARAEGLAAAILRWPQLRGTGDRLVSDVRAQLSETGAGQVVLKATEPTILDLQRQFATDILRIDPQPDMIPPSRRPKPVDPFDVRFW